MRHLTEKDYVTSSWSGGKTVQIAIAPEGAVYADRDFLWRLSSATVELEESDFTVLPDYDRLIMPLEGEMKLTHKEAPGETVTLKPCQVHAFDGAGETRSEGCCTDFNLMLKKGKCVGKITPIQVAGISHEPPGLEPDPETKVLILYCAKKSAAVFLPGVIEQLVEKEALILEEDEITSLKLAIPEDGCLIAAEIREG